MDGEQREDGREPMISWHMDKIEALDEIFFDTMIRTAEASIDLINSLDAVLDSMNTTRFIEAVRLGTYKVPNSFISFQRCLGDLERLIRKKDDLIKEIYDEFFDGDKVFIKKEIRELVEEQMTSCSSRERFQNLTIQIEEQTLHRFEELQAVREFPLTRIAEAILANLIKDDEFFEALKDDNRGKPPYVKESKECFVGVKFKEKMRALKEQEKRRLARLY